MPSRVRVALTGSFNYTGARAMDWLRMHYNRGMRRGWFSPSLGAPAVVRGYQDIPKCWAVMARYRREYLLGVNVVVTRERRGKRFRAPKFVTGANPRPQRAVRNAVRPEELLRFRIPAPPPVEAPAPMQAIINGERMVLNEGLLGWNRVEPAAAQQQGLAEQAQAFWGGQRQELEDFAPVNPIANIGF